MGPQDDSHIQGSYENKGEPIEVGSSGVIVLMVVMLGMIGLYFYLI